MKNLKFLFELIIAGIAFFVITYGIAIGVLAIGYKYGFVSMVVCVMALTYFPIKHILK